MDKFAPKLLTAFMASTIFYPAMALAQSSAATGSVAETAQTGAQTPTPPPTESYGDIVVTAQRRDQRLTDVPISITAATGTELTRAGITTTRELQLVTPGLTLQSTGPWLQPNIRGVSSTSTIPASEQNVAIYVDGVYQPMAAANAFELPDVERVEVLKGPQGTLFGRNATGGAIQIITRDPSFTTTGMVSVQYGSYHDTEAKAFLSLPLVDDKLAISVAGSHTSTEGWNHNLLENNDPYGKVDSDILRAKLLAKISDNAKFVLTAFYAKRFDQSVSANSLYNGNGVAKALGVTPLPDKPFEVAPNFPSIIRTESYGFSLKGDIDLDAGTITSTTAYLKNNFHLQTDGDASPKLILQYDFEQPTTSYSQELLFSSRKFGGLSFIVGGYAFHLASGYEPGLAIFALPACVPGNPSCLAIDEQWKTSATSFAGFADATYQFTDKLSLDAGIRFTYEKRKLLDNYVVAPMRYHKSENNFIPRASLQYKLAPSTNLYFTYSQGFKSGLWNSDGLNNGVAPTFVRPEKIKSYEVGFKTSRRMFSFDAAAFYLDYKDIQNQTLDPQTGAGDLENAGAAHIYGGEASLKMQATPELSFTAQGSYVHAQYTKYLNAAFTVPTTVGGVEIGGNTTVFRDASGTRVARTPRLTGNVAVNYEKKLPGGTLDLSSTVYYSSNFTIFNGTAIKQPKYAQLSANGYWTFGDTGLRVGLYGKNLTNRTIFLENSLLPTGDLVSYQEPRSYGVNFQFKF